MNSAQFDQGKFNGSHLHLWRRTTQWKCTVFKTVSDERRKIDYNNVEQKRSWGKRNKPPLATFKVGLKKIMLCGMETNVLCSLFCALVELETNSVLWDPIKRVWLVDKFKQILLTIRRIKDIDSGKTSRIS